MKLSRLLIVSLTVGLVGCANSPARQLFQTDAEVAESLARESTPSLCRLYLKGIKLYMKSPTSRVSEETYFRRNPMIKELLVERGLSENYCHDEEAIKIIAAEIEHDRQKEIERAGAPKINRSINCTSTSIGRTTSTTCY